MYKVFLRDKVINFIAADCAPANAANVFLHPDLSKIQFTLGVIDKDPEHFDFYFVSDNAEELFIHFYTRMRIVAAAGGFVMNEKGEALFIFRRGRWDLPKGKIDSDETEEQAAVREVMEETGLGKVSLDKRLASTYHVYTIGKEWILKETHWFTMKAASSEKLIPQAEEGITLIKWIEPQGFDEMSKKVYRSLESVVIDAATVLHQ